MEDDFAQLTAIDLFCGCGGMTTGLVAAGINVVAAIDIWPAAIETYNANHGHGIVRDLSAFPPAELRVSVDIICGGPPCQGFSLAGKRDEADPRNSLFMEFVKYIRHFQPKAFIMENVIGILSMKTAAGEKTIDIIMGEFEGYSCEVYKLYASDYEVPQNRRRVIIIGIRGDLGISPSPPPPIAPRPPVGPVLLPRDEVPAGQFLSPRALAGIAAKRAKSAERGVGFGAQILDPLKPSFTIPARYWKDGYDALVCYPDGAHRRLTVRELARIQSFPENYKFCGSKKDTIIQIGNAVPPKFAEHIAAHLLKILRQ
jgi:DNA (cytosine-5)-methyltransferase 1